MITLKKKLKITLEAARVNAGLTQDQVAEKMQLTRATIIAWEKGRRILKIWELDALCEIYGLTRDDIFLLPNSTKSKQQLKKIGRSEEGD